RQRTHMLAKSRDRRSRRDRAVSAARHDQLLAGDKLDWNRRALYVTQLFLTATRTLRARGNVVLDDRQAQQVQADDVIAQIGAETSRDRFRDLNSGKLDGTLAKRVRG